MQKTEMKQTELKKTEIQKELILQKLREHGFRITKQREVLLDIILEEGHSCCKEIYYKAVRVDKNIGMATVYRMLNVLEDVGAINRRNIYKIVCDEACAQEHACTCQQKAQ